jgi:hypothetical protein
MTGKRTMGIESLWSTTEAPVTISKEIMEQHRILLREYQMTLGKRGPVGKPSKSLRDAEEVARANLRAFERLHDLTSPDPRIG